MSILQSFSRPVIIQAVVIFENSKDTRLKLTRVGYLLKRSRRYDNYPRLRLDQLLPQQVQQIVLAQMIDDIALAPLAAARGRLALGSVRDGGVEEEIVDGVCTEPVQRVFGEAAHSAEVIQLQRENLQTVRRRVVLERVKGLLGR